MSWGTLLGTIIGSAAGRGIAGRVASGVIGGLLGSLVDKHVKGQNNLQEQQEGDLSMYYELLGCPPEASNNELQQHYRQTCAKYHPDRISGKKVPKEIIDLTEERFKKIQEAYAHNHQPPSNSNLMVTKAPF